MLEDLSVKKRRTHRYALQDLLRFDRKTDGSLLGLVIGVFTILTSLMNVHPDSVIYQNGAFHNLLMSRLIFGQPCRAIQGYFAKNLFSISNVFPLYPFLLGVFAKLFFGRVVLAAQFLSLCLSCLSALVFYRLCLTLKVVTSPFLTACIFTVFPLRSIFLRMIANEYNTVVLLISLVFLARRIRQRLLFAVALFLLILSSESGVFVALFVVASAAISRNRADIQAAVLAAAAGFVALFCFHRSFTGSGFAFLFDAVAQRRIPFKQMMRDAMSITNLRQFHGMYGFYVVPVITGGMLVVLDPSIGLPVVAALLWAASRQGVPTFDLAVPLEAFAVLLGADALIASKKFKTALWGLAPAYLCAVLYITLLYLRNRGLYNNSPDRDQ